ncbi:MAG: protein kinase [Parachlamydiales bacterium]|nr:protein kinase [Parachlamydiales bacterium]
MKSDFHKQTTIPDLHAGAPRLPLPKHIGPYKIESLLNKGGMSILYLGTHPETIKPIVIKVLLPKYCKNKEMANRFLNEAQIIGMTHHPNIVRLYGQGEWEKGLYIAMEFVQGISLRQFIQQKSLSRKRALEIILQVAYALCHLHTHGVVHRDLKPENILITESGEIKVIDFGIAQMKSDVEKERITQKKRLMGTPVYMSPEQKENPSKVTFATDIYSLGIIAYELILGRLSHGVIHLALLPKRLRSIIEKSLKENPKERYADIVDFITEISKSLQSADAEEEAENSEEIFHVIEETRKILIPKKAPKWPQIEIGLAVHEGMSLSALYIDFFHLTHNRYAIVLAEPLEMGASSLLQASILRGMVRMALRADHLPAKIISNLNQTICNDPAHLRLGLCLLVLDPEKDQMSFISCKYTEASHISEGSLAMRTLATPNQAIGSDLGMTFLETSDNWNPGDRIILHSAGIAAAKTDDWLRENLILPGQSLAEKMLKHWTDEQKVLPKQASAVITINRIF